MAADVIFPTAMELHDIAQDLLPQLMADRPIFDIFPVKNYDTDEVSWEQKDPYRGLQQVRGLNGEVARVKRIGQNRYSYKSGKYADEITIEEDELTRRRKIGTFGTPIDLTDITLDNQNYLLQRRLNLQELMGWTLLTTNAWSAANGAGAILHSISAAFRTYTSTVSWSTLTTATPLQDFREVFKLHRGYSVDFDAGATAYMNQTTYQYFIQNNNPNDLYGRRTKGLETINNQEAINSILTGDNLPKIKIYDKFYLDENGVVQLYIPDNKVVVVGRRPGNVAVGAYAYTRNASNADFSSGAFTKVIDSAEFGRPIPRQISVMDGHNGGLLVEYPSSVIIMSVG